MNKLIKLGSMLIITFSLTACSLQQKSEDLAVLDTVVTEVQEDLTADKEENILPEFLFLEDKYCYQLHRERFDGSVNYLLSNVKDGNNKMYAIYISYLDPELCKSIYSNISMTFTNDKCYFCQTSGVIGENPNVNETYTVNDVNYKDEDFEEYNYISSVSHELENVSNISRKEECQVFNSLGEIIDAYRYNYQLNPPSDTTLQLIVSTQDNFVKQLDISKPDVITSYIINAYKEDETFEFYESPVGSISYSEALEQFKDALRNASTILMSESLDVQKESFKYEEILQ